jgi:membrane protein
MLRTYWNRWLTRFDGWWSRQNQITHGLPDALMTALGNFRRYGLRQSAALSFYAIFSIFPLALLGAVLIGAIFGQGVALQQIRLALSPFLPPNAAQILELFEANFEQAFDQSGAFGLLAVISLIWSGLGLFSNITSSLDFIFRVPSSRSIWRERIIAVFMAFVLIVLLLASLVTSAVLRIISAALLERPSIWLNIGALFLPMGLNMVIFALLFRYVPARRVHWDAVWPSAILGAIGWELAKTGFGWYLSSTANFQFVYGGIATVIVLLFWAYLVASIFMLSAEICAQLNEWIGSRQWEAQSSTFLDSSAEVRNSRLLHPEITEGKLENSP